MVCEISHANEEDKDHERRLDGHETAMPSDMLIDSQMPMENDMDVQCMKAYRLLRSMEEYADEATTAERRQEISDMWSDGIDVAWSEMFEGASTIAASVAGLATAFAVLSF